MQNRQNLLIGFLVLIIISLLSYIVWEKKEPPKAIAPIKANEYSGESNSLDPKSNYLKAMEILKEKGPEEASSFIQPLFDQTRNSLYFFALAWIDYDSRNYAAAKKRVEYLILTEPDESDVLAFALHLGGYLSYLEGNPVIGMEQFARAEKLNLQFERPREVFRNRMGMVRCLTFLEDYEQARDTLRSAYDSTIKEKIPNLPYFYTLSAFVEYKLGHFEEALRFETIGAELLEQDNNIRGILATKARQSLYYLTLGDLGKAKDLKNEAIDFSRNNVGDKLTIELKVLTFVLERCEQERPTFTKEELIQEINKIGSPHDQKLFKNFDQWPCPSKEKN